MTVAISTAAYAQILAEAAASPDVEVCGLLFGTPDRIDEARAAANVATDPSVAFEVDPAVLFAAIRAARNGGPPVVGSYHSHPSGLANPSATDAAMIREVGEIWLIIAGGALTAWRASGADSFEPEELVLA